MRVALAFLLLFARAHAALAGVESCEKLKDADAYNNCLASFGPVAGEKKLTHPPLAEHLTRRAPRHAAREQAPPPPEAHVSRKANGRVRLEFLVPSSR